MIAVLINRPVSKYEIHEIGLILKKNSSAKAYTTSNMMLPFPAEVIVQDSDIKKKLNHKAMADILSFGEIISNGMPITDRLTINGMSLWHYHKFRLYFLYSNLLNEMQLVKDYSHKYSQVIWFTAAPDPLLLAEISSNVSVRVAVKQKGSGTELLSKLNYLFYLAIRLLQGIFSLGKTRNIEHLIIDRSTRQPCLDLNDLSIKMENYNLAYIIAKAGKNFAIIDEIEIPKFSRNQPFRIEGWMLTNTRKHLLRIPGEYLLVRALFNPSVRYNSRAIEQKLKKTVSQLAKENPEGYAAWILKQLQRFHSASALYIFKNQAYNAFFKTRRIKSISTIDENSPNVKSIIDSARLYDIKTIGIQHGIIHDLHPAYVITPQDLERNILCDKFIAWGQNWKEYLSKRIGYPESMIFIAGQPRTDIIPVLNDRHEQLVEKLHLPNKKIVVFASQPLPDKMLRERAAFDVFSGVSRLDNVHLLIKLHPAEVGNPDYYTKIAQQTGCTDYSIMTDTDLYLIIAACDLLITISSTVGAETVYFGKPLIILDHLNEDLMGYVKQEVAFKATNQNELTQIINGVIDGELKIDEIAYTNFIEQNAYRIDGKASQRILDIIGN